MPIIISRQKEKNMGIVDSKRDNFFVYFYLILIVRLADFCAHVIDEESGAQRVKGHVELVSMDLKPGQ